MENDHRRREHRGALPVGQRLTFGLASSEPGLE
jgi:hypothetical protein